MPYSKCPICGQTSHLNVSDPASWYAERYPQLPFGGLVPARCFYCFVNIESGDDILIRAHFTDHPDFAAVGVRGTVTEIASTDDGDLYYCKLDGGDDVFVRGELRKPHDNE